MTAITAELSKPEYAALTDEQALAALHAVTEPATALIPATTVNQLFAQLDLTGVIQDIAADHQHVFRHKMASVILSIGGDHPFNFSVGTIAGDGNLAMLDAMIANLPELAAKLTQFKATVYAMANKKVRPFASVTLNNVVAARAGETWQVLPETSARKLRVMLNTVAPEQTHIVIQMSEDGANWFHATALHGIQAVRPYYADLPFYGVPRQLRWRCEYVLDCSVTVV